MLHRYKKYPSEPCPEGVGQNWTAYCMYKREMRDVFDSIDSDQAITSDSVAEKCPKVLDNMVSRRYECRDLSNCRETDDFYESCFDRTSDYALRCNTQCTDTIQSVINLEYCKTRKKTMDVDFGAPCPSTCSDIMKEEVIVNDFCFNQAAYKTYVPDRKASFVYMLDLQSSTCSTSCIQTLQTSMTIPEWIDCHRQLVDNELPGTCSKTVCDCDSNAMSGSKCHLSCL